VGGPVAQRNAILGTKNVPGSVNMVCIGHRARYWAPAGTLVHCACLAVAPLAQGPPRSAAQWAFLFFEQCGAGAFDGAKELRTNLNHDVGPSGAAARAVSGAAAASRRQAVVRAAGQMARSPRGGVVGTQFCQQVTRALLFATKPERGRM